MSSPSLSATQMVEPSTVGHILYQIYHKLSNSQHYKAKKGSLGRQGLNVGRLMSVSVALLVLTHKTGMYEELVFDIASHVKKRGSCKLTANSQLIDG